MHTLLHAVSSNVTDSPELSPKETLRFIQKERAFALRYTRCALEDVEGVHASGAQAASLVDGYAALLDAHSASVDIEETLCGTTLAGGSETITKFEHMHALVKAITHLYDGEPLPYAHCVCAMLRRLQHVPLTPLYS